MAAPQKRKYDKPLVVLNLKTYSLPMVETPEGLRAQLSFGLSNGKPRFSVFLNSKDGRSAGTYGITMDGATLSMFSKLFAESASDPMPNKNKLGFSYPIRDDDGAVTGSKPAGELKFGKDEEGYMWLTVTNGDQPKGIWTIKYFNHESIVIKGKKPSEIDVSVMYAVGFVTKVCEHLEAASVHYSSGYSKTLGDDAAVLSNSVSKEYNSSTKSAVKADVWDDNIPF